MVGIMENKIRKFEKIFRNKEEFVDFLISIYDLNGHLIDTGKVNSDLFVSDLSACRSGLYLIVLSDSNIFIVNKFVLP